MKRIARAVALLALAAGCNTISVQRVLAPPAALSAIAEQGAVLVTWSQVPNADLYDVYVTSNGTVGPTDEYGYADGAATSMRVPCTPGRTLSIAITSVIASTLVESPLSGHVQAKALSTQLFGAGTQLTAAGTTGSDFGHDVAAVGDVDGDGVGDILVGAPAGGANGVAYLFSGASETAITVFPGDATHISWGQALAGPANVTGDGLSDVIVGSGASGHATVYDDGALSATREIGQAGAFDLSLAAADVDRDGFGDVAVGFPSQPPTSGKVVIAFGASTGLASGKSSIVISDPTTPIGTALGFGDFDGDGTVDLLTGAWGANATTTTSGAICFVPNVANFSGAAPSCTDGAPKSELGDAIAVLGDVDDDGRDDALVVDFPDATARTVSLWKGDASANGVALSSWSWPLHFDPFTNRGTPLHHLIVAPGDVDGDGHPDAIIGDPAGNQVLLFLGTSGGLLPAPKTTIVDPSGTGDAFGAALAWGNVDGDTQPDLIVGSPQGDEAWVFHGLPTHGPVVDAGPPTTVPLGQAYTLDQTVYDPAGIPGALACSIDWGDGNSPIAAACGAATQHQYQSAGTYILTISATTSDSRSGTSTTTVYVQ